ncbi:MAG: SCO1664 family protein [Ilumatobacteraceae bacterium]
MSPDELTRDGPVSAPELVATDLIPDPIEFLNCAEPEIEGRMPWSSNGTFLVTMRSGGAGNSDREHDGDTTSEQRAIYKPVRGERPLWDFEPGLHRRELATYVLSELLGIGAVPPTVIRDGPLGEGSFQWFVDADHREHYFTIFEQYEHLHDRLREIAVLDILANNTDRKSGHCLLAADRIWAIDNGLCFSREFKLRTVIWEFAGEDVTDALLDRVAPLVDHVPDELADLLDDDEIVALRHRATKLVTERILPHDETGRRYPWPLV